MPPQVPRTYEEQGIIIFSLLPNDNSMEMLTKQSNKLTGEFITVITDFLPAFPFYSAISMKQRVNLFSLGLIRSI